MSEADEYDAYYLPVNPEDFAAIDAAAARALAGVSVPSVDSNNQGQAYAPSPSKLTTQRSVSPPSPDEFAKYDLSEFTADDFVQIDAMVLAARTETPPSEPLASHTIRTEPSGGRPEHGVPMDGRSDERGSRSGGNGGPRIQIAVEGVPSADASSSRYLKDAIRGRAVPRHKLKRSPYDQFRRWNRLLSVTDLASPSWCEVQFDYGLRQKRNRKLADRPESFVTAEGKMITVAQTVAAVNDRTVTRGRSVHKVLEREFQPETTPVDVTTAEERWALRLVNMLVSLQTLLEQGRCREVPVFGMVHDQIVTGIIDEIARKPVSTPAPDPSPPVEPAPSKSSPNKRSASRTPRKSVSKKSRQESDLDQPQITSFFTPSTSSKISHINNPAMSIEVINPSTAPSTMVSLPEQSIEDQVKSGSTHHSLHLSDTKTRVRPTLPPDEDTYASRIQLMLYHRLLSNLLGTAEPSILNSQPLDFNLLWQRAGVDPYRKFSESFISQAGLSPSSESASSNASPYLSGLSCLDDLTAAWRHAVEALSVTSVDKTLTLVYRSQRTKHLRKSKGKGKEKTRDPNAMSLSDQEAQDLAAAIQASISDVQPGKGGDDDLARAIFESLKDSVQSGKTADGELGVLTHPFGPPISEMSSFETAGSQEETGYGEEGALAANALADDPQLAWALQRSLLSHIDETPALKEVLSEPVDAMVETPASQDPCPEPMTVEASHLPEGVVADQPDAGRADKPIDVLPETVPSSPSPAARTEESSDDEDMTAAELETEAKIIGTKELDMDDSFLDEYLTRVLAWWYGQRAPEGVDVELTRRCVTCEYRDGCEWREKKADEALQKYRDRSGSGSPSVSAGAVETLT